MRRLGFLVFGLAAALALTPVRGGQALAQTHSVDGRPIAVDTKPLSVPKQTAMKQSVKLAALPSLSLNNFSQTGQYAKPPIGWTQFCGSLPLECESPAEWHQVAQDQQIISLTRDNWATLNRINTLINDTIEQVSDLDHYGVLEWWAYPDDGKGDCEDLQLLKRKLLMDAGMPRQTLLMTVVRDKHGEGHAVLMVRTDRGDLILDSRTSTIKMWQKTDYKFIKRQSQDDQNLWVYFGDGNDSLTTASPAH